MAINFDFRRIKNNERKNYKTNLDVDFNESYFDPDEKEIYLEFPVKNRKIEVKEIDYKDAGSFGIIRVRVFENGFVQHRKKKSKFVLQVSFNTKTDMLPGSDTLNFKKDLYHVLIINNDIMPSFVDKSFRPDEAGGGVIVEGP